LHFCHLTSNKRNGESDFKRQKNPAESEMGELERVPGLASETLCFAASAAMSRRGAKLIQKLFKGRPAMPWHSKQPMHLPNVCS
jgi:hypothetical protein